MPKLPKTTQFENERHRLITAHEEVRELVRHSDEQRHQAIYEAESGNPPTGVYHWRRAIQALKESIKRIERAEDSIQRMGKLRREIMKEQGY